MHQPEDADVQSTEEAAEVLDGLRRIVQGLRQSSHAAERKLGVSGAQLFVLSELAEAPGSSIRALSERTLTDPSSVSVVVSRLVGAGLVSRRRAPEDARRSVLEVTPAGKRLLARAPEPYQARLITALRAMPASQRRQFGRALAILVEAIGPAARRSPLFFEDRTADSAEARPSPPRRRAASGAPSSRRK